MSNEVQKFPALVRQRQKLRMEMTGDVEIVLIFVNCRWICDHSVLSLKNNNWESNKLIFHGESLGEILGSIYLQRSFFSPQEREKQFSDGKRCERLCFRCVISKNIPCTTAELCTRWLGEAFCFCEVDEGDRALKYARKECMLHLLSLFYL